MEDKVVRLVGWIFFIIGLLMLALTVLVPAGRLFLLFVALVFGGIGGGLVFAPMWRRRRAGELMQQGRRLDAEFLHAVVNSKFSVNGRHPYRMLVRHRDPITQLISTYESHNIWFDPTDLMQGRTVAVYVDKQDASKYYVDTLSIKK